MKEFSFGLILGTFFGALLVANVDTARKVIKDTQKEAEKQIEKIKEKLPKKEKVQE